MKTNLSDVGEIQYEWDFDQEEYQEWLQEEELEDSPESLSEYIDYNVTFQLTFLDNITFHPMDYEDCNYDDLVETFGESVTQDFLNDCKKNGGGRIETIMLFNRDAIDVNNPDELNERAMEVLPHGQYYKGCRGFILTNGVVVYTPMEHNHCSSIYGIKGTFHFMELGNPRVLENGLEIWKKPTSEQERVIMKVLQQYRNDTLYIDLRNSKKTISKQYSNYIPEMLYDKIINFFELYESHKPRTIVITESQKQRIFEAALPEFNLDELSSITSLKGRYNYCRKLLGPPQGRGSSRVIFQIDDQWVLKLALNKAGLAQNEAEGTPDYYKDEMPIFPQKKEYDPDGKWIVSEFVLPAKPQDFVEVFGFDFNKFISFVATCAKRHRNKRFYVKTLDNDEMNRLMENNRLLYELNEFIGCYPHYPIGDLMVIGNYGMALRDGKPAIVILDSGLTDEVWETYYKRR